MNTNFVEWHYHVTQNFYPLYLNTVRLKVVCECRDVTPLRVRQLPMEGDPPAALDSPVAYGGKPSYSAGSTFASLQGLSLGKLSYPNRIALYLS